jgi:hypothetical protein
MGRRSGSRRSEDRGRTFDPWGVTRSKIGVTPSILGTRRARRGCQRSGGRPNGAGAEEPRSRTECRTRSHPRSWIQRRGREKRQNGVTPSFFDSGRGQNGRQNGVTPSFFDSGRRGPRESLVDSHQIVAPNVFRHPGAGKIGLLMAAPAVRWLAAVHVTRRLRNYELRTMKRSDSYCSERLVKNAEKYRIGAKLPIASSDQV